MPLGLMPEQDYIEGEMVLKSSDRVLFYYMDGMVEAHNPDEEMFGLPKDGSRRMM